MTRRHIVREKAVAGLDSMHIDLGGSRAPHPVAIPMVTRRPADILFRPAAIPAPVSQGRTRAQGAGASAIPTRAQAPRKGWGKESFRQGTDKVI